MTRALMECYIYVSILKNEQSEDLINEWWLCNIIHKIKDDKLPQNMQLINTLKDYCQKNNIDFKEKWKYYTEIAQKDSGWLRNLMGSKGVGVKALCEYINEKGIYTDYESASSFIHAQDITTKLSPFTFYSSIYSKLYLMMYYIFKTIRLFEIEDSLDERMINLEEELLKLGEKYLK